MNQVLVSHPTGIVKGKVFLEGSKSIANRVLIIRALCKQPFQIYNLPHCDDTQVLLEALSHPDKEIHNVKLAGTAGRFLTAFFAVQNEVHIIDAEEGLRKRPLKPLLDALSEIGCIVKSLNEEGCFPLNVLPFESQKSKDIHLPGHISSQFISALLLVAPTLPKGLTIQWSGDQVSRPYIEMTISIMEYFGVKVNKTENSLVVKPQNYIARDIEIEGDWTSASYYFGLAALSKEANLTLVGLKENSWQGDAVISNLYNVLGVKSSFEGKELSIVKSPGLTHKPFFENDFLANPDLFQTVSVTCAGLSLSAVFTGLDTLPYKESNRIVAIQNELLKCGIFLNKMPEKFSKKSGKTIHFLEGKYEQPNPDNPFETYQDHRMAMSLAQLAIISPLRIKDPNVVEKSYPQFWEDLKSLGFQVELNHL